MKRIIWLALITAGALSFSGCSTVSKVLDTVTPEISVGIFKDGVGGINIGVKLSKPPEDPHVAEKVEDTVEDTKQEPE